MRGSRLYIVGEGSFERLSISTRKGQAVCGRRFRIYLFFLGGLMGKLEKMVGALAFALTGLCKL